jgi:hypothetical protein
MVRQVTVEHLEQTAPLLLVALYGRRDLLGEVAVEDVGLPHHGADAAHLEHQPLDGLGAALGILRQQLAGFLRQIEQDGAGFEHGEVTVIPIDDGRDAAIGVDGQKLGQPVGQAQLFQRDRGFVAIRRGGGVQIDHGGLLVSVCHTC